MIIQSFNTDMEQQDGKLMLRPMADARDLSILKAIANGMSAREQIERILPHEADFMDRVRSVVSNLAVADVEHDHISFALSRYDARLASVAIQANTSFEQQSNNGLFMSKGSALANAALPEILRFEYQA
jgi:hypothetical protein